MSQSLPYRKGVGILLFNRQGLVWVGKRIDQPGDCWQMPQGGIDDGEEPRNAMMRELAEEIGSNHAEILAESRDWLTYDLPPELLGVAWKGKYRGQKQKWYAARFLGDDSAIRIDGPHPEFSAWRWVPFDQLTRLIVPFKRALYEQITAEFAGLAKELAG